jgi:hypothetical protein
MAVGTRVINDIAPLLLTHPAQPILAPAEISMQRLSRCATGLQHDDPRNSLST